mgnify:CR=1 FL=1
MKKIKFIPPVLVILALAFIVTGCGKLQNENSSVKNNNADSMPSGQNDKTQKQEGIKEAGDQKRYEVKLAGTRIDLQNINSLMPGNVTLAFKLFGLDAKEFVPKDLKITNEKPLHLLVVRDDLTGYQHLHPDYVDERWTVATEIPQSGKYYLYVDIEPVNENPTVLRLPVVIGEPTQKKKFPSISKNFSETLGDLKVMLDVATPIKAKELTKLNFKLTQNNNPVTKIEPYLGSFGHVVALSHTNPDYFEHAHPATQAKPMDGSVKFKAEFPVNGMYTIFAQFNINGQVKTFPITIEVASGNEAQKGQDDDHM